MNICFAALCYPSHGGAASGVASEVGFLAENLALAGNSITIIALRENGQSSTTGDRGAHIIRVPRGNVHWFVSKIPVVGKALALPIREIEYSLAAWRGVRRAGKVDVIEGTETGMVVAALLCRRTPLVIRLHGERYTFDKYTPGQRLTLGVRLSRVLQRYSLRRATVLISPSKEHAREIARELGLRDEKIRIVPNGVTTDDVVADTTSPHDRGTVLFAGRLERVKGVPVFLEAARNVLKEIPNARFVLTGGSHPSISRSEIDEMIRVNRLENNVQLLGYVPRQKLLDLFRKSTLCVVPSHYETFGLVALEAMKCGLPVVATRAGALPELVEDGVTGWLVSSGDHAALAAAIVRLLRNPAECSKMGEAARRRTLTEFSVEKNIALNLRVYEEISAGFSVPVPLKAVQEL